MAQPKDIVLIYLEDTPVNFARIEEISPDQKKNWFQVRLLILQVPVQVVTWILRAEYINGDTFSMNGKSMRLEQIESPTTAADAEQNSLSHEESPEETGEGCDPLGEISPPEKEKIKDNIIYFPTPSHNDDQEQ